MVMRPGPLVSAIESVRRESSRLILLSPTGRPFDQPLAHELADAQHLVLVCGRYEGVDERVRLVTGAEELSIGDFVLSGGELAAAVVVDCVARLLPGVLGNEDSAIRESFGSNGLLDCPQYTRPADFRGWKVPEILIGGNHEQIRKWREQAARDKTANNRPDLLQ